MFLFCSRGVLWGSGVGGVRSSIRRWSWFSFVDSWGVGKCCGPAVVGGAWELVYGCCGGYLLADGGALFLRERYEVAVVVVGGEYCGAEQRLWEVGAVSA